MFPFVQGSDAWKAARFEYLTATEAANLMDGMKPIDERRFIHLKAHRISPPVPPRMQELFDWGHANEAVAAHDLEELLVFFGFEVEVYETGLHVHQNGWLSASPDRFFRIRKPGKPWKLLLVEIKCTHWRIPVEPRTTHRAQVWTQLEVIHSQEELLRSEFLASLLPSAWLFYWCPRSAPRIFVIERATDFPFAILKKSFDAVQTLRAQEEGRHRDECPCTSVPFRPRTDAGKADILRDIEAYEAFKKRTSTEEGLLERDD